MSVEMNHIVALDDGGLAARHRAHDLLETTLDVLPFGIVIVDRNTQILHANTTATLMLGTGTPIMSQRRHLGTCSTATTAALSMAVRRVTMGEELDGNGRISVPLSGRDGRIAIAHVQALDFGVLNSQRRSGDAAAIFISEARARVPPPVDALTTIYDLTCSEARVLEHIAAGRTRGQTAATLGVAVSTVKTHLDHIYIKTGTSDQLGLCRLVAALSWPELSTEREC